MSTAVAAPGNVGHNTAMGMTMPSGRSHFGSSGVWLNYQGRLSGC
eukprot:CAMPEP_0185902870 /NCGR_PEP_ID=MMETSP0196C-20130402/2087_1 /TAXON_ID=2932 /ORGANISM="Alexandrium fundyense, Strain CCMP1719" /LENGTH=44 /DNA_ID= /DNA_START= /DNA_END= /DNA_ORIENTATION=